MNISNLQVLNKTILIPDFDIEVSQYISIEDRNSIVYLALQNAEENGMYNEFKLQMFFELYIVYLYSNLEITSEQKENPIELYDVLKSNGIIDAIIDALPSVQYMELCNKLAIFKENKMRYHNSIAATLNSFVENLPVNAEQAREIIEKFNPEDFQRVIEFATAANGNRPLS